MRSKKRRDIQEAAIKAFFFTCGILAVLVLVGIFLTLLATAVPAFREIRLSEFLGNTRWDPTSPEKAEYGLLSMIMSTLLVTTGALLLAVPIGIGVAAYLSDVAHWRVREILKPVVEILAGIPSVVVGFLGIVLFGPFLAKLFHTGNGLNALNGSILLAIMALPTIISISEDSLNAVPARLRRGLAGPRRLPLADPRSGSSCRPPCPASSPRSCSAWAGPSARP